MTGAASLRAAGIASERAGSLGIAQYRSRSLEIAHRSPGIAQVARDRSRSLEIAQDRSGSLRDRSGSRRIAAGIPVAPALGYAVRAQWGQVHCNVNVQFTEDGGKNLSISLLKSRS